MIVFCLFEVKILKLEPLPKLQRPQKMVYSLITPRHNKLVRFAASITLAYNAKSVKIGPGSEDNLEKF
jgi:hypothetical protein